MEFIENAEGFYNGITFLKRALLDARVKKDEKKEKEMINEMESYLFHLKQFLGTIIERKNNIVDLGEVWHTSNLYNFPTVYDYYEIVAITDGDIIHDVNSINDLHNWLRTNATLNIQVEWAYIKDLLPKGGD